MGGQATAKIMGAKRETGNQTRAVAAGITLQEYQGGLLRREGRNSNAHTEMGEGRADTYTYTCEGTACQDGGSQRMGADQKGVQWAVTSTLRQGIKGGSRKREAASIRNAGGKALY